jgi:hypothetical protein
VTSPVTGDLARTLLGSGPAGYGASPVMAAVLTVWNPTLGDPSTYGNRVTDGAYVFDDCLVMFPSQLVLGRVLLLMIPGGPVIMGNTYQKPPPTPEGL